MDFMTKHVTVSSENRWNLDFTVGKVIYIGQE